MQIQCHHCGKSSRVGPAAKAALCPYCRGNLHLPGKSDDSLAGQVGFAEIGRQKLSGMLDVFCAGCQRVFHVPIEYAGRNARCPACRAIIRIPDLAPAISPAPVQPSSIPEAIQPQPAPPARVDMPASIRIPHEPHAGMTPAQMAARQASPLEVAGGHPSAADVLGAISSTPVPKAIRSRGNSSWGWAVVGVAIVMLIVVMILLVQHCEESKELLSTDPLLPATATAPPEPEVVTPRQSTDPSQPTPGSRTPRTVVSQPDQLIVANSQRDVFAGRGFGLASPGKEFWRLDTTLLTTDEPFTFTDRSSQVVLRCDGIQGEFVGVLQGTRQLTPVEAGVTIPPRQTREVTLVFEMPAGLDAGTAGTLQITGLGEEKIAAPDAMTQANPSDVGGDYFEIPPRNLRPVEADPIVARIQRTQDSRLAIAAQGGDLKVALPDAGVTGRGEEVERGLYRLTLTDGQNILRCRLRLAGPDRVILYLTDEPFSQLTFARGSAEDRLPPLPGGLVAMDGQDDRNLDGDIFTRPSQPIETNDEELFHDHDDSSPEGMLDF